MLRLIVKLILLGLIGYGVYFYFFDGQVKFKTSDLPAVSFDQIVDSVMGDDEVQDEPGDEESEVTTNVEEISDESKEVTTIVEEVDDQEKIINGDLDEGQIPTEINLAVPFTSQAPHANWALPYQEACEEASAYMVSEYFKGTAEGVIDPDVADAAILEVVDFQTDFLGHYLDTTAAETVQFIDMFYGIGARVIENPTVEQIKTELAEGRPVILPAAGRELGNPNFVGEGPLYHMLVIKGYTANTFITNDPGTRNGENYVYEIDVLMNAMGDWNGGDPATGASRVIFLTP